MSSRSPPATHINWRKKEAIGRACAELIQPNQTVIIDAGTTAYHVARYLESKTPQNERPLARVMSPDAPGLAPARVAMDEKRFGWMLNEDAMATEKLAEGIRTFAHDLKALRDLVGRRLAMAA